MGVFKKNNRWYIDFYIPANGKRRREVVNIPGVDPSKITRRDAIKALDIRRGEVAEGKFNIQNTKKKVPFTSLMNRYLEWAKDNHKAPERDIAASKPLLSFFGNRHAGNMNLWQIEKYKAYRKQQDKQPETINKELSVLRRMFNLAMEWKIISINPISGMKLLKVPQRKFRVLTESEFKKLYNSASDHFKPILLAAYLTGMRRGEIQQLKWKNVNLKEGYILVTETKNYEDRVIPLNSFLLDTLKELKKNSNNEYVFTTQTGEPYISQTAWKRTWKSALKNSGIEHCRFHDLRHTFCSNLIVGEKEDFATVMSLTGHKDISMLKRYSHTQETAKKAAVNKLGKGLNVPVMDTYLDTEGKIDHPEDAKVIDITS